MSMPPKIRGILSHVRLSFMHSKARMKSAVAIPVLGVASNTCQNAHLMITAVTAAPSTIVSAGVEECTAVTAAMMGTTVN